MTRRRFRNRRSDAENWRDSILEVPSGQSSRRYKQNRRVRFDWHDFDEPASIQSCLCVFVDVYRHHAIIFARYCEEGRSSEKQLPTIERLRTRCRPCRVATSRTQRQRS